MRKKPISRPKAKEKSVQASIIKQLLAWQLEGKILWMARINSGQMGSYIKFNTLYTPEPARISDIIGQTSDGTFFAIEAKKEGFKFTPHTKEYIAQQRVNKQAFKKSKDKRFKFNEEHIRLHEQYQFIATVKGISGFVSSLAELEKLFTDRLHAISVNHPVQDTLLDSYLK